MIVNKITDFLAFIIIAGAIFACQEEDHIKERPFSFEMLDAMEVDYTDAILRGKVDVQGMDDFDKYGMVWNTEPNPEFIGSSKKEIEVFQPGIDTLEYHALNLKVNSFYYVRTFMVKGQEVTYGNQITFKTRTPSSPEGLSLYPMPI